MIKINSRDKINRLLDLIESIQKNKSVAVRKKKYDEAWSLRSQEQKIVLRIIKELI